MLNRKIPEFIWINGKFVPYNESNIHVLTHSLHYAGAVFEGIRAYNGKVFKLEEHTERLLKSAEHMQLDIKYTAKEINDITYQLLEKNSIENAYIRPLIWRGAESVAIHTLDLSVNILIAAFESQAKFVSNLKLKLGKWRKPSPDSMPPQAKSSTHYGMAVAAQSMAQAQGYDDSLILDYEGFVAECNVANIFFGKGSRIVTPIADRFLNGITRQSVMLMAKKIGFEVKEARIHLEELADYDYCFLTGTAKEVGGIGTIDLERTVLNFPDPEEKVKLLQSEFAKMVGK